MKLDENPADRSRLKLDMGGLPRPAAQSTPAAPRLKLDRNAPASAVTACSSPCCTQKTDDDKLSAAAQARMSSLTGTPVAATGLPASDSQPQAVPSGASACQKKAITLAPALRRFNRYREALPAARAAGDMNGQMGPTANDPDKPVVSPCLTRLPTDAEELNKALGLPAGTIQPRDLRQEETGFRAALYRDEGTGRLILVARDTQPTSLVDWMTNTRNGDGQDTDQYGAARELSKKLSKAGAEFDVSGYSKGGGLAQEMALINPRASVYVFNSAGLHEKSLERTGNTDFASLINRTKAFSAQGDFLTYMNETTDPAKQIENALFLRREVAGENHDTLTFMNKMQIDHMSPAAPDGAKDPAFLKARDDYLKELDDFAKRLQKDFQAGKALRSFPPVRAGQKEAVRDSAGSVSNMFGANADEPNTAKLYQHLMQNVLGPMEKSVKDDRADLQGFLKSCR